MTARRNAGLVRLHHRLAARFETALPMLYVAMAGVLLAIIAVGQLAKWIGPC